MISLNLVSEEIKKEGKMRDYIYLTQKVFTTMIFFTVLIASILFLSSWILHNHYNYTLERANIVSTNSVSYENQVKEINKVLNGVIEIQSGYFEYSRMIMEIMEESTKGIKFSTINFTGSTHEFEIKGRADTRDALLAFNKLIEGNPNYEQVDFPLTNILLKENIDFSIKAKFINPDEK